MKKKEFLELVRHELQTIKERATKEEIAQLNFSTFKHENSFQCIYGQMTGNCRSQRAQELYPKKFYDISLDLVDSRCAFRDLDFTEGEYFTPLEQYLFIVGSRKHKELIQYLKGERNEIKLT